MISLRFSRLWRRERWERWSHVGPWRISRGFPLSLFLAQQPDQIAHCIIDSKAMGKFMPSVFPPAKAQTIGELAALVNLPVTTVEATIKAFNDAVQPGTFNHAILDNCKTSGLKPEKTHWALPIDRPPFYAYGLRPGITFTYLGVKVDERANVQMKNGQAARNIFAAGEIMAGSILGKGYVAGFGVTIGTVFGRIAGREAAITALSGDKSQQGQPSGKEASAHASN